MIKELFTTLSCFENILYFNEDSGNITGVINIDLNNINFDTNFDEDDRDTIIHIRFLASHIELEKCKALKKN